MPKWQPAALLRKKKKKIDFWRDFKKVIAMCEELKIGI